MKVRSLSSFMGAREDIVVLRSASLRSLVLASTLRNSDAATLAADIVDPSRLETLRSALVSNNGELLAAALPALNELSADVVNCHSLARGAIADALFEQLDSLSQEWAIYYTASTIANLTDNVADGSLVIHAEGLASLLRALERCSSNRVALAVATTLVNLSWSDRHRYVLLAAGVVLPLLHLVLSPRDGTRLQALTALKRLSSQAGTLQLVANAGGVCVMERLLRAGDAVSRESRSLAQRLYDLLQVTVGQGKEQSALAPATSAMAA